MKCPIDETELTIAERSGVEIDYCPRCRGVWLDRGELDKILDRADSGSYPSSSSSRYDSRGDSRYDDHHGRKSTRRRGGFLGELFDF